VKRSILILLACLILSPTCCAESSADRFFSNLSDTWDSFLDLAEDTGKEALQWAEDNGIVGWVEDRASDVSAWAKENGLTDWAESTLDEVSAWFDRSGIAEWATGTSREIQAFVEENRPTIEAWLNEAGQEVSRAWDTLVNAGQHTQEEVEEAYDIVTESLEEASN